MPHGKLIRDREALTLAVAIMLGQGKSVARVSDLLGVSQKSIYRLRAEAIGKGWLVSAEVFTGKDVPPELLRAADERIGVRDLVEPLSNALEHLAGFPVAVHICGASRTIGRRPAMVESGRNAAAYLKQLLMDSNIKTVAVAYGTAVHSLLAGLREISPLPFRGDMPITCIPLRGDPGLDAINTPSALAWNLSQTVNVVNTDLRYWRSPTAVPPVMPDPSKFNLPRHVLRETLETYLRLFPDYSECFGPEGLINHTQLIITSVGPPNPVSRITQWMFQLAGFQAKELPLAGDVAGIPILDSTRATDLQRKSVERFEAESLIGATSSTFYATIGAGGRVVVVVFADTTRAQCLLEIIQRRMATDVLIDKPVAKELIRLLEGRGGVRPAITRRLITKEVCRPSLGKLRPLK